MTNISGLTSTVITLFIIVITSFAATKFKLIDDTFTKGFSKFVICVAQPFMIIDSLCGVQFSLENLKKGFTVTGLGFISLGICAAVAFLVTKPFKNRDDRKIGTFALVFANTGFMGIPVLKALFGDIGAFYGAFFLISFQVVLWTYGMVLLGRGRDDIKVKPLNLLLNFGTVPCIIGILLYILPFDLPGPVASAVSMLGSICAPGSMIIVGSILASVPIKELFLDWKVYLICAMRLLALPALVCGLCVLCRLPEDMVYLFTTLTALPCATNCAMYAQSYDISPALAAKSASLTTLLSVLTVPLMLWLAKMILSLR